MERDDTSRDASSIDWDAAFEAIVAASWRPSRSRRALQVAGQALLGAALLATSWWLLMMMLSAQMEGLSRPWY